jgi:hypothetical protein
VQKEHHPPNTIQPIMVNFKLPSLAARVFFQVFVVLALPR